MEVEAHIFPTAAAPVLVSKESEAKRRRSSSMLDILHTLGQAKLEYEGEKPPLRSDSFLVHLCVEERFFFPGLWLLSL